MKTNTIIALAAGAAILACIKKQKGTSGVGRLPKGERLYTIYEILKKENGKEIYNELAYAKSKESAQNYISEYVKMCKKTIEKSGNATFVITKDYKNEKEWTERYSRGTEYKYHIGIMRSGKVLI